MSLFVLMEFEVRGCLGSSAASPQMGHGELLVARCARPQALGLRTFFLVPKGRNDVAGGANPRKSCSMSKQSPGGAIFLNWGQPMSPLQGLGSYGKRFRGLKPTSTSCRRCAAEGVGKAKPQARDKDFRMRRHL
ncbi:MAG: hypothetical protein CMJ64_10070 [Planctomycetaceae bacterium]|nr:hypothetical protein [Planctomycetaceae bacterium]